jgi:hypothetical protein
VLFLLAPQHLKESTMSTAPKTQNTADELPRDLSDLAAAIGEMPAEIQEKLNPSLTRVTDSTRRRRRILTLVQEALGQLRLDMKYLMFDLEATRRERDDFLQQLQGEDHDEEDRDEYDEG